MKLLFRNETMQSRHKCPTTFDGSMPSVAFGDNAPIPQIGQTYFFDSIGENGMMAQVTTAMISEDTKQMYIGTDNGHVLTMPVSDEQIQDYKAHKDTFLTFTFSSHIFNAISPWCFPSLVSSFIMNLMMKKMKKTFSSLHLQ